MSLRLAFMGSPDFAVPALKAILGAGHEVACVYCQPPRPAGRGRALRATPVQAMAEDAGLEVRTPINFKAAADREAFAALELDLAVVVAYGLLLPAAVLAAPRLGCFNLHASLLPRWRGAAPIHRAVMAGDKETGIEVMKMEVGLDTGPILSTARTSIGPTDTAGTLHDRLARLGADLIVSALDQLEAGRVELTPQSDVGALYAAKITPTEARIDWSQPASRIDAQIRGLSPSPGAWFELVAEDGVVRVKALEAALEAPPSVQGASPAGLVLDERLLIACGDGAVRLTRLQRAGKGPLAADAFLHGVRVAPGTRLT